MGTKLKCGCVTGAYWCAKHDIYRRQNRATDPRWTSGFQDSCSCHINPPCGFCVSNSEIDDETECDPEPAYAKVELTGEE